MHASDLIYHEDILTDNLRNFTSMLSNYIPAHKYDPVYAMPFSCENGMEMFHFALPSTMNHFPIRHETKTIT